LFPSVFYIGVTDLSISLLSQPPPPPPPQNNPTTAQIRKKKIKPTNSHTVKQKYYLKNKWMTVQQFTGFKTASTM